MERDLRTPRPCMHMNEYIQWNKKQAHKSLVWGEISQGKNVIHSPVNTYQREAIFI